MPIRRNPSLGEVFAGHDEDEDKEAGLPDPKKTQLNEDPERSRWDAQDRGDDDGMELDNEFK